MTGHVYTKTEVPEVPGIYCLHSRNAQDCYVGSAMNLQRRMKQHASKTERGFGSYAIRGAVEKHGVLHFKVLEKTEPDRLVEREQYWIDLMKPSLNVVRARRAGGAAGGCERQSAEPVAPAPTKSLQELLDDVLKAAIAIRADAEEAMVPDSYTKVLKGNGIWGVPKRLVRKLIEAVDAAEAIEAKV